MFHYVKVEETSERRHIPKFNDNEYDFWRQGLFSTKNVPFIILSKKPQRIITLTKTKEIEGQKKILTVHQHYTLHLVSATTPTIYYIHIHTHTHCCTHRHNSLHVPDVIYTRASHYHARHHYSLSWKREVLFFLLLF